MRPTFFSAIQTLTKLIQWRRQVDVFLCFQWNVECSNSSTVVPIKFWIHYLWSPTLYLPPLRYSIQHTALVPHFLEALIFLNHQAHYSRCHWWFMTLLVRSIHFPRQCWVVFFSKISHKWYLWFHWIHTKIFFCVVKFWIFRVLYIVRREQRKDFFFFLFFWEIY